MTLSSISKTTGFEIQTRGILYVNHPITTSPPLRGPHYQNQADLLLPMPCVMVFFSLMLTRCHRHFHSDSNLQRSKGVGVSVGVQGALRKKLH